MLTDKKLYLVPNIISNNSIDYIPKITVNIIKRVDNFIAESRKTTFKLIKLLDSKKLKKNINIIEIEKENYKNINNFLDTYRSYILLSDSGNPCIADPGYKVVDMAHKKDIRVIPITGPCSITMAVASSGMNSQSFCFNGYLPIKKNLLVKKLKELEKISKQKKQVQVFMETPYRNSRLFNLILDTCNLTTELSISYGITDCKEFIKTMKIKKWKSIKNNFYLDKIPAIFSIFDE